MCKRGSDQTPSPYYTRALTHDSTLCIVTNTVLDDNELTILDHLHYLSISSRVLYTLLLLTVDVDVSKCKRVALEALTCQRMLVASVEIFPSVTVTSTAVGGFEVPLSFDIA